MADVRPFRGWRFDPSRVDVGAVLCPPYDVISPQEQRAYHERDPHNVVRVELGLGPTDPEAPGNRYLGAAQALADWRGAGALIQEPRPAIYLYEQQYRIGDKSARRRGLLGAGRLHDPSPTGVLPHEDTRKGPITDRLALLRATATNVSPLWLLYEDGDGRVGEVLGSSWEGDPVAVATADGETHRLWVVDDPRALRAVGGAFATRPLYIADGHHRYKTAQVYRDERRQAQGGGRGEGSQAGWPGGGSDPDGGQEFALMLLVPLDDPGLTVLPTHRLVRLGGRPPAAVRAALEETMTLEPLALPDGDAGAVAEFLTARLAGAGARGPRRSRASPGPSPVRAPEGVEQGAPAEVEGAQRPTSSGVQLASDVGRGAEAGHAFVLLERDGAWLLRPRSEGAWRERLPEGHGADWQGLDVAVLDALVIRGALGIRAEQEAAQARATEHGESDALSYVSDAVGAVQAVRSGAADQAYLLNPTRVEQVCAVAAGGDRMPPKSTFFFPKPVTGLVLHALDGTRPMP